jgi:hypothetical protein
MKQQTAVEWLALYIKGITSLNCDEVIEKAKAMEKEKMCKFAYKCHNHYKVYGDFKIEEYYNETFKQQEL